MKRRDFINTSILTTIGSTLFLPNLIGGTKKNPQTLNGRAKNIIFLVSDGMSNGTLTMADLLLQRKEGKSSKWIQLYRENKVKRAFMDTASADSLVTDSAAASSSWGGGVRVKNGALNISPDGTKNKPILQKFKNAGKSVGCVTTVPITHATPAGFCVNAKHRNQQEEIAAMYLSLKFDVMMGGGMKYFMKEKRKDKKDLIEEYKAGGFQFVLNKSEMEAAVSGKPLMAVFDEEDLPYSLDQASDNELQTKIPSLASMTKKAIELMSNNPEGFVLQVEGGKVDWGAHANDVGALLYDQIAFDEAIAVAIDFAENSGNTLVIITTDHGNSNPGLIKSNKVDQKFDLIQTFKYTNEWVLNGIKTSDSPSQVIERFKFAQGIDISKEEAQSILDDYSEPDNNGIYNAYKLPYRKLAQIQQNYTSVGWSGMDHSGDFVELAMFGPGSEMLPDFVLNTDLHSFMLKATGVTSS